MKNQSESQSLTKLENSCFILLNDKLSWPDEEEQIRNMGIPEDEWVEIFPPIFLQHELDEFIKVLPI